MSWGDEDPFRRTVMSGCYGNHQGVRTDLFGPFRFRTITQERLDRSTSNLEGGYVLGRQKSLSMHGDVWLLW